MTTLIDTRPFQRLRHVKQLSTAEYVYVNANHNRFEHSLGVAHLAQLLCRRVQARQPNLECTDKDVLCVKLAGLLHDVGHGMYSHTYEKFVTEEFPKYLARNGHLNKHYASLPPIPKGWRHEVMSLLMIDAILKEVGLAIDLHNLDQPLRQIGDGVDAKTLRVFEPCTTTTSDAAKDTKQLVLTSRDFVFIKECIWGGPIPDCQRLPGYEGFVGRPRPYQEWLYDIVSNRHSGLDVDKMDYYARDQRRALRAAGEIDQIFIDEAVVAWAECTNPHKCFRCRHGSNTDGKHLMLCYPDKMVKASINFFRKRSELHDKIYKHKAVVAVSYMICDILCLADPYFPISTGGSSFTAGGQPKREFPSLPMSRAMLDDQALLRLRDDLIPQIGHTTCLELQPARDLIDRLESRLLYKCVGQCFVRMSDLNGRRLWAKREDEIKSEILLIRGEHMTEDGHFLSLNEHDFIVQRCDIHWGSKENNPVKRMRFLTKTTMSRLRGSIKELPEARAFVEEDYDAHLPRSFQENSIRVYCREPEKSDLVKHMFELWKNEIKAEIKQTALEDACKNQAVTPIKVARVELSQDFAYEQLSEEEPNEDTLQTGRPSLDGSAFVSPNRPSRRKDSDNGSNISISS
jgi:HD superfamily phosphohydrolase